MMNSLLYGCTLIGMGFTVLGAIFFILSLNHANSIVGSVRFKHLMFTGILVIIMSVGGQILLKQNNEKNPDIDRSNYTVYLDGQEVDRDKVDLSLYKVRYDDEDKVIYITAKTNDHSDGILGFLYGYTIGRSK